jgi:RNA polymerase sigma factor (sigma-70 family)
MTAVARNELVESVARWVHLVSRRLARGYGLDPDDVAAETFAVLLRHADKYDPTRGKLTTWSALVARRTASKLARREWAARMGGRVRVLPGVDSRTGDVESEEKLFGGVDADPGQPVEDADSLAVGLALLPDGARALVETHYGLGGRTPTGLPTIAAAAGVSRSAVGQRVGRAVAKMRAGLTRDLDSAV